MDENENKGLKTYESPPTKKTQVELEGNLCGSTNHTAQSPGTTTTAQEVNQSFGTANDFTNDSWDNN